MSALAAGCRYFLTVFAVGFVLGTLRTLFVAPRFGETTAVLLELPLILAAAWIACGYLLRRRPLDLGGRAVMGATAFALLMLAEASLSLLLFRRSLNEHLALYAEAPHLVGLAGQVLFGLMPLARGRC